MFPHAAHQPANRASLPSHSDADDARFPARGARSRGRRRSAAALLAAAALVLGACTSSNEGGGGPTGSTPGQPSGTRAGGAGYEATIRRTGDGVPHITGRSLDDVTFGQGYASFEDRSCELADQVLKVKSERAQWFGVGTNDANLKSDVGWQALGIVERATRDWPQQPDDVHRMLEAFTAGWNRALQDTGVDGIAGWCRGQQWVRPLTALDVYTYARSITLQASGSRVLDYIVTAQPPASATTTGTAAGGGTGGTSGSTGGSGSTSPTAGEAPAPSRPPATARPASAAAAPATVSLPDEPMASNGWAIGRERSANGGGLLLANPHFPWEGELRFWEVQLTVPGEVDISGVQLSGLPGVGIGFTDTFGWTHTVSAGNRFTAYTLDLVPGKPTTYRYGTEERAMTSKDVTVKVRKDDGSTEDRTQTVWYSHYGPILNFPGVGWTEASTITYRDANIDNSAFLSQYLAMDKAKSLDELIAAHERHQGVPLFNTIAVSNDGRAWYADTSATPNLSKEALAAYEESLKTNPIVSVAAQSRAIVLDGSNPIFEWVDEPGARSPGLVPYSKMPKVEARDYVFNANDSFWISGATPLTGDYSPLHGRQNTVRSPRTRENAEVLRDVSGPDRGMFDIDSLREAALRNEGYTARELREAVVARCTGRSTIDVPTTVDSQGKEVMPAATVDVSKACDVLRDWDGIYDLDRRGPMVWRELIGRFEPAQLSDAGPLWAQPFDPSQPITTPNGLAEPPPGGPDPVLVNLGKAVQLIEAAGHPVDATLGDVQFSDRNGTRVPIHGGTGNDGVTNIVGWGSGSSTREETPKRSRTMAPRSDLTEDGYWINNGTSFLLALEYTDAGPQAYAFLTYSDTQDRSNPSFTQATERFSKKEWRKVLRTDGDIRNDPAFTEKTIRS